MYTVKHPYRKGTYGITCGQRKDGSRAVLWSDNTITWYSATEFDDMLWLSEASVLAEEV